MAVIKRGILGGFQNKIANVVGSSWKGIATMRSLPISVANPRTVGQVRQRTRIGTTTKIGSMILATIIKPLWDRFAQQESGFNAFTRKNVSVFFPDNTPDISFWQISQGTLYVPEINSPVRNQTNNTVTLTWPTSIVGEGAGDDRAYIALFTNDGLYAKGYASVAARSAGTAIVTYPNEIDPKPLVLHLAFRSLDGTKVSNSTQVGA